MIRALPSVLLLAALGASAQYVPPVPKTVTGGRALNRTADIPLPSPKERWVRARSSHFLTISSAGERRTREVVSNLETVAAALRQLDPHFAAEGELTRMIIFAKMREAQPYFNLVVGRSQSPGAFVLNAEGIGAMLIDASSTQSDRPFFHELVHNLLANSGSRLPLWLEEGMAEYFSTAEVSGNVVRIGRPIGEYSYPLRNRPLMHLGDLFAVQPGSDTGGTSYFYAESWAVVDWMMRADRPAFFALVSDIEQGTPAAAAIEKRFHVDPTVIERGLQGMQVRPPARLTLQSGASPDEAFVEQIDRDAVIIELATFLGGFEATRSDAERFLKTVVDDDPANGHALAAIATLRAKDKRYDEATKLYERALELAPKDADIRLTFAESLLGNAIGPFTGTVDIESADTPRFRRARQLAGEALAGGADGARADAVIGTSYLVESDVKPGIEPLQRARALRPNRYDIALNLYALLLRSGDRDAAGRLYDEISSRARTPQAIFAAKAVYVREQLAQVNRLIAANRIDDAIPILDQLIAATPDANAKADLERQLLRVRETGEANREIMAYNEAVDASNRGDTQKAIEILDKIIETATDPAAVRNSIELRKQLQKRLKGMRRSPGTL